MRLEPFMRLLLASDLDIRNYQTAIACAMAIGNTSAVYIYTRMLVKSLRWDNSTGTNRF